MATYRCDNCDKIATHVATKSYCLDEYYCDDCVHECTENWHMTVTKIVTAPKPSGYMGLLPDGDFTEDDLWEAIAEANGVDVSEIMDGDLVEWL